MLWGINKNRAKLFYIFRGTNLYQNHLLEQVGQYIVNVHVVNFLDLVC